MKARYSAKEKEEDLRQDAIKQAPRFTVSVPDTDFHVPVFFKDNIDVNSSTLQGSFAREG